MAEVFNIGRIQRGGTPAVENVTCQRNDLLGIRRIDVLNANGVVLFRITSITNVEFNAQGFGNMYSFQVTSPGYEVRLILDIILN
jgi:hypothetical protein